MSEFAASVPPPATSGPVESPEAQVFISRDGGIIELPEWDFGDYYATVISLVLMPLSASFYLVMLLTSLPFLALCSRFARVAGPTEDVQSTPLFGILCALGFVLHLPVIALEIVYVLIILLVAHALCAPVGIIVRGPMQVVANWRKLCPFVSPVDGCPSFALWSDFVAAVVAVGCRQGFFEFAVRYTRTLAFNPVNKYLFNTNPWIGKLATRHCNQWTEPMKFVDTAEEAMILLRHNISRALHRDASLVRVDDAVFAAAYPHPPKKRDHEVPLYRRDDDGPLLPTAVGVEYAVGVHFVRVGHAPLRKRNELMAKPQPLSQQASSLAYAVSLGYLNPLHPLTGYVEVNLRPSLQLEHPMWCVLGAGYWPHKTLADLSAPFFLYAPDVSHFNQHRPIHEEEKDFLEAAIEAEAAANVERQRAKLAQGLIDQHHHEQFLSAEPLDVPPVDVEDSGDKIKCEPREAESDIEAGATTCGARADGSASTSMDEISEGTFREEVSETNAYPDEGVRVREIEVEITRDDDPLKEEPDLSSHTNIDILSSTTSDFELIFKDRDLGFGIALQVDKTTRRTTRVVVASVSHDHSHQLQIYDELIRIDDDVPNALILAKDAHGLAHFAALVNRIRQGPRPVTMGFRRHSITYDGSASERLKHTLEL